jgi:hypothetical protein
MFATRQIIDDPQEVISVPPEFQHRRIEVIFMALESNANNKLRANWFDGYEAENDVDVLASLPSDEASEEWEW